MKAALIRKVRYFFLLFFLLPVPILTVLTNGKIWLWEKEDTRYLPEALLRLGYGKVKKRFDLVDFSIFLMEEMNE